MTVASRMHLSTIGSLPCAQCGHALDRPVWSEPVDDCRVLHLWNCSDCGYVFETMVLFGAEDRLAEERAEKIHPLAA